MHRVIIYFDEKYRKITDNYVVSEVLLNFSTLTLDELISLKDKLESTDGDLLLRVRKKNMFKHVKKIIRGRNYHARKWCEERYKIQAG